MQRKRRQAAHYNARHQSPSSLPRPHSSETGHWPCLSSPLAAAAVAPSSSSSSSKEAASLSSGSSSSSCIAAFQRSLPAYGLVLVMLNLQASRLGLPCLGTRATNSPEDHPLPNPICPPPRLRIVNPAHYVTVLICFCQLDYAYQPL